MKKAKLLASLKHSFRESVAGINVSTSKVVLAFVFYGIGLQWYESELSGFQIASIKKDHKELQAKISQSCIYSGILGFLRNGSPKNENTVIISSPSCCSKPVWIFFLPWNTREGDFEEWPKHCYPFYKRIQCQRAIKLHKRKQTKKLAWYSKSSDATWQLSQKSFPFRFKSCTTGKIINNDLKR